MCRACKGREQRAGRQDPQPRQQCGDTQRFDPKILPEAPPCPGIGMMCVNGPVDFAGKSSITGPPRRSQHFLQHQIHFGWLHCPAPSAIIVCALARPRKTKDLSVPSGTPMIWAASPCDQPCPKHKVSAARSGGVSRANNRCASSAASLAGPGSTLLSQSSSAASFRRRAAVRCRSRNKRQPMP